MKSKKRRKKTRTPNSSKYSYKTCLLIESGFDVFILEKKLSLHK